MGYIKSDSEKKIDVVTTITTLPVEILEISTKNNNVPPPIAAVSADEIELSIKNSKSLHKCTFDDCNKSFLKPSRLQWHLRQHTGERPYECKVENCDRTYTTSSHLKRHHARTHSIIQESIMCLVCQLTLKSRENFRKHYQRVHNNENRILCNECGALFRKKYKLDEHMAAFHNNLSSLKCKQCDEIFKTTHLLKKHVKARHEVKILKCTEINCNEEFPRFMDLRIHQKNAHSKEFHCVKCGKCLSTKSRLNQHMKTHEFSIFSCPYDRCSKIYSFKRNLQHHIRKKHMGILFYCDICGAGLAEKSSLMRHIKNVHSSMMKVKKCPKTGSERVTRKDAGIPRKSMVTKLIGLDLNERVERKILNRKTKINSIT